MIHLGKSEAISDQEEISPIKLYQTKLGKVPEKRRPADGTFNGLPVHLQVVSNKTFTKPKSLLHCVAEDYQTDNWTLRSCHLKFICLDVDSGDFSIYSRPEDSDLYRWSSKRPFMDLSQTLIQRSTTVSLGGIEKNSKTIVNELQYFPQILEKPPTVFYSLPDDVVMIPFRSNAAWDPRRIVWEDFLSAFNLMYMFQLEDTNPLLIRHNLPDGKITSSCSHILSKPEKCKSVLQQYWPLMTSSQSLVTSQFDVKLELNSDDQKKSKLVCAKNGLLGVGALTDHGTYKTKAKARKSGKRRIEEIEQNHGRGDLFWKFRSFCLRNLGLNKSQKIQAPYEIIFSSHTLNFEKHVGLLEEGFDSNVVSIQSRVLNDMELVDRVSLISKTSILVTNYEEQTYISTFLPWEATLILFYDEFGSTDSPSRHNWDLFNNLSFLRVHWFPIGSMDTDQDMDTLLQVSRHALNNQQRRNW
jgi:hypothetical protein